MDWSRHSPYWAGDGQCESEGGRILKSRSSLLPGFCKLRLRITARQAMRAGSLSAGQAQGLKGEQGFHAHNAPLGIEKRHDFTEQKYMPLRPANKHDCTLECEIITKVVEIKIQ